MVAERAFVIDKEPQSVKRLSFSLKKMGFFVEEESDPRSALEKLQNGDVEFDIVFIEQKMPTISGIEILRDLQSSNCKSCVIFMTKKPDFKTIVSVMQEGAFSFLEKPIDYKQLGDVVKKGLENRQAFFQILEMGDQLKKSNSKLKRQSEKLKKEKTSLKRINQELKLLNQLSLQINSTLDAHKMLDKVIHSNHIKLNEIVKHDIVTFFYFLGEDAFLKIHSSAFTPGSDVVKQLRHASIKEYSHYTGEKLLADDVHTEVIKGKALRGKKNKKSTVARDKSIYIPLNVADDVLGIMGLVGVQKISENRGRLISTMANQVALALKNATEHKRVQELAITDELTGLYNRRAFQKALDKELRRSKRYKKPLSLIMLDIDGFKEINDKFGHQAGDGVLRSLALNLQRAIREIDFLARYGGDEFAVILPETKAEEAVVLAERLKKTEKNCPISTGGSHRNITLSIGVADISECMNSEDELISQADRVLYLSKENGGDTVEVLGNA
ncbi:MAG: diguanylate cyclase [Deltaproteobacteria bacterium]|nr:diguanylate cyclase [Deltaproteobacteria bacterium]